MEFWKKIYFTMEFLLIFLNSPNLLKCDYFPNIMGLSQSVKLRSIKANVCGTIE